MDVSALGKVLKIERMNDTSTSKTRNTKLYLLLTTVVNHRLHVLHCLTVTRLGPRSRVHHLSREINLSKGSKFNLAYLVPQFVLIVCRKKDLPALAIGTPLPQSFSRSVLGAEQRLTWGDLDRQLSYSYSESPPSTELFQGVYRE